MPTEAFFKLEDKKREQIINAAVKEFSELPYAKVSIFKIAQRADVSRSGFYYYFKDKKDIYEYLLNTIKDEFLNEHIVEKNKEISLFDLTEHVFEYICSTKGTTREALLSRVIADITPEYLKALFFNDNNVSCNDCEIKLNLEDINYVSFNDIKQIAFLLSSCILFSVGGFFQNDFTLEESRKKLHSMIDIIKFGIAKGEEN